MGGEEQFWLHLVGFVPSASTSDARFKGYVAYADSAYGCQRGLVLRNGEQQRRDILEIVDPQNIESDVAEGGRLPVF